MNTANSKKPQIVLDRMTKATLGDVFEVPLSEIKQMPEVFRHRDADDLDPKKESMLALQKNLITEGQRDPLIVYRAAGRGSSCFVCVGGHRRSAAMRQLATSNTPGFSLDMPVRVREILGGTHQDYLLWSISDNEFRESIDELHRIEAAIALMKAGVDHTRIKVGLAVSDSTFDRYRRLAQGEWMLEHVRRDEIGLTDAHKLLETAGSNGGEAALGELREDLSRLIGVAKDKVRARREELAEQHKDLKGNEALVKSHFPRHLVNKWILDLKQGRRIQGRAKFVYAATIANDKQGKRLVIPAITIPIVEKNLEALAEVIVSLDRVLKNAKPEANALARQRSALNERRHEDGPTDFRSAGLDAVEEVLNPRLDRDLEVTPEDREATLLEANRSWDDQGVGCAPSLLAIDGVEIADEQPESDD